MFKRTEQSGSTLVEALIALLILTAALVSMFGAMSSFLMLNNRSQLRSNAAFAARARMEDLRFTDPETMPTTGTQSATVTVGTHNFAVVTEYCATTTYCNDSTRHVVVTIQEHGKDVFETETVFTQLR